MSEQTVDETAVIREALDAVESKLEGDVILYNGPVNEQGYGQFIRATQGIKKHRKVILILVTLGGSADSAYRIARYAQNYFEEFLVFVPSVCKSAGTLVALGALKIFMSPSGELGPLDVQVYKSGELFERRSGLLSKSAVWSLTEESFRMFESILLNILMRSGGTIGFKASSQVAASITGSLISPVIAQLDPLAIGEDYQNLHIAHEYGDRLVQKYGTVNEDAVRNLVEDYPSHGFVIDLFEASELLGNVELATPELFALQASLSGQVHRPNASNVTVARVRELLGGADEQQTPPEAASASDGEGSDPIPQPDGSVDGHDRAGLEPAGNGDGRAAAVAEEPSGD